MSVNAEDVEVLWNLDEGICTIKVKGKARMLLDFQNRFMRRHRTTLRTAYALERIARRKDEELRKYEAVLTWDKLCFKWSLPFSTCLVMYRYSVYDNWRSYYDL